MNTTAIDPPTLAERLRDLEAELGTLDDAIVTHAADVLDLLAPRVVEMIERVIAEGVPDGWTATAASYVVLTHDDGRKIVATHHTYPTRWGAVRDDDRHVEANTLAALIELVTA